MNKVLIVGSIALDSLKTPYGERDNVLGGSLSYASVASRMFSPVNIVGIVGDDFPQEHLDFFKERNINTDGLKISNEGTFRWKGYYEGDMSQAVTVDTQLNAFANFNPVLTPEYAESDYVFLGNIHPALQLNILNQIDGAKFTMMDTMNLWINETRETLLKVINRVDLVLLNEGEARMLCNTSNLVEAAQRVLTMGPKYVIIKKGEHGALMFSKKGDIFASPAYPLNEVKDPTGAGDTFAGGLIGCLAKLGDINSENIRQSIVAGTVLASFTTQDFSLDKLKTVTEVDMLKRFDEMQNLTSFKSIENILV